MTPTSCRYCLLTDNTNKKDVPEKRERLIFLACLLLLHSLFNSNCASNCRANHRVVAHTDKSHHLNVSRNRGRAGKLCIRMHSAECIGHTVGSRTCSHIVRVQSSSCTAARSNGEVLLACICSFLLVLQQGAGILSGWWSYL